MAEELVALETAKMLIKKGFNECRNVVDINNMSNGDLPKRCFSQPTQSLAQKWLREVKNLHIEIYRSAVGYGYAIVKADNGTWQEDDDSRGTNDGGLWDTYEEALEAGIIKALSLL